MIATERERLLERLDHNRIFPLRHDSRSVTVLDPRLASDTEVRSIEYARVVLKWEDVAAFIEERT